MFQLIIASSDLKLISRLAGQTTSYRGLAQEGRTELVRISQGSAPTEGGQLKEEGFDEEEWVELVRMSQWSAPFP